MIPVLVCVAGVQGEEEGRGPALLPISSLINTYTPEFGYSCRPAHPSTQYELARLLLASQHAQLPNAFVR